MKKKLLILVFLLIIIPKKVNAFAGELELSCDKFTININEDVNCTLYGKTDSEVSAVETHLVYDDDLKIKNEVVPTIWQGSYENKVLLLYTDTNKTTKFELLTFKVSSEIAGTKTLSFETSKFSDKEFNLINISSPKYTFTFTDESQSTDPEIIDDDTKKDEEKKSDGENVPTGAFLPITLIGVLSVTSGVIYFKTKKKKIYKL